MNKTFTTFKINTKHLYLWFAVVLLSLMPRAGISQSISIDDFITSPSPYCAGVHSYTGSNSPCATPSVNYKNYLDRMELGNYYHDGSACFPGRNSYSYFNETPIKLVANSNPYILKITMDQGSIGRGVMAWFDLNLDNKFSAEELLEDGTNFGFTFTARTEFTRELNIPCNTKPGIYRLRIACDYSSYPLGTDGCNFTSHYGETWDFDVEVIEPVRIEQSPDFIVPSAVYIDQPITFRNNSYRKDWPFEWDWDNDGIDAVSTDFTMVPSSVGVHPLKLTLNGCGESKSVTKSVNVISPSKVPGADFYATKTVLEEFDETILKDISSDGPTDWYWEIDNVEFFTPMNSINDGIAMGFGNRYNYTKFMLDEVGYYEVCLTATNNLGSFKRCKTDYIEVIPFSEFKLGNGPRQTDLGEGTIFDKFGPEVNYSTGNNGDPQVNNLRIVPCGAEKVILDVVQFKFAEASHNLKIWDGPNALFGTPLHPAGGFNPGNTTQPFQVVAHSGSMYMELDTKSGSMVDSGLIAYFHCDYGVLGDPVPHVSLAQNKPVAYTGAITQVYSTSENISGLPEYYWEVEGVPVSPSSFINDGESFTYTFPAAGTYKVALWIKSGCNQGVGSFDAFGDPTGTGFVEYITVVDPTSPTEVDFVASNTRPDAFDFIEINSITDKANRFQWTINPPTYTLQVPFTLNSKDLRVSFDEAGAYDITLTAWNSDDRALTEDSLVKTGYIAVVDYCVPSSQIVSADVANRKIVIEDEKTNSIIYSKNSTAGVLSYESFTSTNEPKIELILGGEYNVSLTRNSRNSNTSQAVYIDFNGDGIFDMSEQVHYDENGNTSTTSSSFKVPDFDYSYVGDPVRLRVVTSFEDEYPTPCGPLPVGEYEDYFVVLKSLDVIPTLALLGDAQDYVEQGLVYNDPGALALDDYEGDISDRIIVDSDLDENTLGTYTITYSVKNSSGNSAVDVVRTVTVTSDNTAPAITLSGNNPDTIEVFSGVYVEPGYSAHDFVDGDVTGSVVVNSNLNENVLGTYQITYTVSDVAGNEATEIRTVVVVDNESPQILSVGTNLIELGEFWYDQTVVTDNYWSLKDITFTKTYGLSGPVRWDVKGIYEVHYYAVDGSGNDATLDRTYIVDDFTAPKIHLNTADTVNHEVGFPYTPTEPNYTDNNYSANSLVIDYSTNLNTNELGIYTETYKAIDGSGNTAVKTRWINVVDRTAPVITAPSICSKTGYDFDTKHTISVSDNYYSENVLLALVQTEFSNVNPYLQGNYSVTYTVTDPSGNKSLPTKQYVMISNACDLITGVQEVKNETDIRVYPNPSNSGIFTADLTNYNGDLNSLQVVNSIGTVVKDINLNEVNDGKVIVDISNFASGVYILNVSGANGNIGIKLMVVK